MISVACSGVQRQGEGSSGGEFQDPMFWTVPEFRLGARAGAWAVDGAEAWAGPCMAGVRVGAAARCVEGPCTTRSSPYDPGCLPDPRSCTSTRPSPYVCKPLDVENLF